MATGFAPWPAIVAGKASEACRAVVIVPARNEEAGLPGTLDALAAQVDGAGRPIQPALYEVLLLLNNCTDASAEVARASQRAHPKMALHVAERGLRAEEAHAGTARRMLMDTAYRRLEGRETVCGILSTDSDSVVAPDWLLSNLAALDAGADAVGGVIELKPGELERLPAGARRAYGLDREYQRLVAELEDRLDPQPGDPSPRHLEHFGASLGCTPAAYARAGGLPPVHLLEDMAFVDALRRVDAHIRHDPRVRVFTSARFDGRAPVGLSWQLRTWQAISDAGEEHRVRSAAWLQHRFQLARQLRELYRRAGRGAVPELGPEAAERVQRALAEASSEGAFLQAIDADSWMDDTFQETDGESDRESGIEQAIAELRRMLAPDLCEHGPGSGAPKPAFAVSG